MREIPLTKGFVALVDDEDYAELAQFEWCYSNGYAVRAEQLGVNKWCHVKMHRHLLGLTRGDGISVDHRDENKLNNQRENLRQSTTSQNTSNRRRHKGNTSGAKGVCWDKSRNKWYASIMVNRKSIYLGRFESFAEAKDAYAKAALRYHGEFANTDNMEEV